MKNTNKFFAFILSIFFFLSLSTTDIFATTSSEIELNLASKAKAAYLYSFDGDRVLYTHGEDSTLLPVSTAKMMAGVLVCERYEDILNKKITVTSSMLEGHSGTSMGLKSGMTLTVNDLLYGTVCGSNNDAATVLAYACTGSVDSFVEEMNKYAKRLDMRNTKYSDPTGIATTAETYLDDVAKLAMRAASNELYVKVSSTPSYDALIDGQSLTVYNRNALISQFSAQGYLNKSANGLIAGGTDEGGYVLATCAQKNDKRFLCIVMGASVDTEEIYSYKLANQLLDCAFDGFSMQKIASCQNTFYKAPVALALTDKGSASIKCKLANDVFAFLPNGTDIDKISYKIYIHDHELKAPISENSIVGGVDFYYGDIFLASSKLISIESIEPTFLLLMLDNLRGFLVGRVFWITLIIATPAIVTYIVVNRKSLRKRSEIVRFKRFY